MDFITIAVLLFFIFFYFISRKNKKKYTAENQALVQEINQRYNISLSLKLPTKSKRDNTYYGTLFARVDIILNDQKYSIGSKASFRPYHYKVEEQLDPARKILDSNIVEILEPVVENLYDLSQRGNPDESKYVIINKKWQEALLAIGFITLAQVNELLKTILNSPSTLSTDFGLFQVDQKGLIGLVPINSGSIKSGGKSSPNQLNLLDLLSNTKPDLLNFNQTDYPPTTFELLSIQPLLDKLM